MELPLTNGFGRTAALQFGLPDGQICFRRAELEMAYTGSLIKRCVTTIAVLVLVFLLLGLGRITLEPGLIERRVEIASHGLLMVA